MDWTHVVILYLTIGVVTGGSALSLIPHEQFNVNVADPATILSFLIVTLAWPIFLGLVVYYTFTSPEPRFTLINTSQPIGGLTHFIRQVGTTNETYGGITEYTDETPENSQESSEASDDQP